MDTSSVHPSSFNSTAMPDMSGSMPGSNIPVTGFPAELLGNIPSHGIHSYNVPCVLFFSVVGLILQVPVIYTHCGLFTRPNVPVLVMSFFYLYTMLSTIVSAVHWHSENTAEWWNGSGFCDFDVRMVMAISLGVQSAQCVINWNVIGMLANRPKLVTRLRTVRRGLCELTFCLFLPALNIGISTFIMPTRYTITQDSGCTANIDTSAATIIVYLMWIPILGLICLVTVLFAVYRFYKRGRAEALETLSFIPHMNTHHFLRISVFALVITCVVVPLSICVAIMNFITISDIGVSPIAWVHGKPKGWNEILRITLKEMSLDPTTMLHATAIVNFITRYVNISISWLLFLCYGTGELSFTAYRSLGRKVLRPIRILRSEDTDDEEVLKEGFDDLNEYCSSSLRSHSFAAYEEPRSPYKPGTALKIWEESMKGQLYSSLHTSTSHSSSTPSAAVVKSSTESTEDRDQPATPQMVNFFNSKKLWLNRNKT